MIDIAHSWHAINCSQPQIARSCTSLLHTLSCTNCVSVWRLHDSEFEHPSLIYHGACAAEGCA
jgi:hypothetical protein